MLRMDIPRASWLSRWRGGDGTCRKGSEGVKKTTASPFDHVWFRGPLITVRANYDFLELSPINSSALHRIEETFVVVFSVNVTLKLVTPLTHTLLISLLGFMLSSAMLQRYCIGYTKVSTQLILSLHYPLIILHLLQVYYCLWLGALSKNGLHWLESLCYTTTVIITQLGCISLLEKCATARYSYFRCEWQKAQIVDNDLS